LIVKAVADTHALIWSIFNDPRLSLPAATLIKDAEMAGEVIAISSISLVEIVYLIEKHRIDPTTLDRIMAILSLPNRILVEIPVDSDVTFAMKRVLRDQVPDMPDRIIAATALYVGVPLISRDRKIQASSVTTIW
jgi:PIN domain nuclease of toxin-antitoxin system